MKCLLVCLAVLFMVAPAMAGEDPYMAIVGNDCAQGFPNALFLPCPTTGADAGAANTFYFSAKHIQFMYDQTALAVPLCFGNTVPGTSVSFREGGPGCESFLSQTPTIQPEICDASVTGRGKKNARTTAGNAGWFEWYIRLPKKPSSTINLVIQCGILKPNAFANPPFARIESCAAETGERVCPNCTRCEVDPGVSPIIQAALPKITAIAYPGPYNSFAPFHLTAWKNPSSYAYVDPLTNSGAMQVLDGSAAARIVLKACMDKTIGVKLPVTAQVNAFTTPEAETDLEFGDLIYVRMDVPRQSSVDVYCNAQSVRLAGVGEFPF